MIYFFAITAAVLAVVNTLLYVSASKRIDELADEVDSFYDTDPYNADDSNV